MLGVIHLGVARPEPRVARPGPLAMDVGPSNTADAIVARRHAKQGANARCRSRPSFLRACHPILPQGVTSDAPCSRVVVRSGSDDRLR